MSKLQHYHAHHRPDRESEYRCAELETPQPLALNVPSKIKEEFPLWVVSGHKG